MTTIDIDSYITGWETAYLARSLIGLTGLIIILISLMSILKKNCNPLATALALLGSASLLVFALYPQSCIRFVISTPYMTRIRLITASISFVVLLITLEAIRRQRLQERYAILWVSTSLAIIFFTIFPAAVALLRAMTGMSFEAVLIAIAFTFLIMVCFHFSISLSRTQEKLNKIVQQLALLEMKMNNQQVEKKEFSELDLSEDLQDNGRS